MFSKTIFLQLTLCFVLVGACSMGAHDHQESQDILDVSSYSPRVAHGVRCGSSLSEFFLQRKDPILLPSKPGSNKRLYTETLLDPLFERIEYTAKSGRIIAITVYSTQHGIYETIVQDVEEILGEADERASYPNPIETRWILGTMEVGVFETNGEVFLQTYCPMEAGR